jgi:hypothetical protein
VWRITGRDDRLGRFPPRPAAIDPAAVPPALFVLPQIYVEPVLLAVK